MMRPSVPPFAKGGLGGFLGMMLKHRENVGLNKPVLSDVERPVHGRFRHKFACEPFPLVILSRTVGCDEERTASYSPGKFGSNCPIFIGNTKELSIEFHLLHPVL